VKRKTIVGATLVVLAACGGANNSPSGPSDTILGLSLSPGVDILLIQKAVQFTATASFSGGEVRAVQGSWGSDASSVATVTMDGVVTGVGAGLVTIFVDYEGVRATRLLRVVPDYAGRWEGGYRVEGCTDSGDWAGICADEDPAVVWRLDLTFTQEGEMVGGSVLAFEGRPIPVDGSIRADGELSLTGAQTETDAAGDYELRISDWSTTTSDNAALTGQFVVVGSRTDLVGEFRLECVLTDVVKVAPELGVSAPNAGPSRHASPAGP